MRMGGTEYWHIKRLLTRQTLPFTKSIVKIGTYVPSFWFNGSGRNWLRYIHLPSKLFRTKCSTHLSSLYLPIKHCCEHKGSWKDWANLLLPRIAAENVTANICWILNWNKCQQYMNLEMQRDRCSPTLNFIWIGDPKQLQYLYSLWGATVKERAEAVFYYFAAMPTFLLKSSPGENKVTNCTSNIPFSDWNPFLKKQFPEII